MEYLIYQYTSPSGKSYIGQTKNLEKRKNAHKNLKAFGLPAFYTAIQKYGYENFNLEIIKEKLTLEEANFWESFYIREKNTISPNGYNLESGGDNKKCHPDTKAKIGKSNIGKNVGKKKPPISLEVRIKMSESAKKRPPVSQETINKRRETLAKNMTDDLRKKFSELSKARGISEETRKKMADSRKGSSMPDYVKEKLLQANIGRKHSEDHKNKISIANTGKKRSKEAIEKMKKTWTGRKHSEESKKKMSESAKNRRMLIQQNIGK